MPQKQDANWLVLALLGGVAVIGTVAMLRRSSGPEMGLLPFDDFDVEAAARMLASENPSGSLDLHTEQIYTQVRRALRRGVSLHEQITAGLGYGGQGEGSGGKRRPVSTDKPATQLLRDRARRILAGEHPSRLAGATKFFEPREQARAFAVAEAARRKRAAGQPLTPQEERLLKYKRDADAVRAGWQRDGAQRLGEIEGIEFWS
jgi:hypothetical protein